jgi:5'-3' exonuclease
MKNIVTGARPTSTKPTIVLLDSHAMLHRSYHAFPYLTSPTGEPSGALFGMCQMLIHVMSEFHPHDVVACFDLPDDTFRHTAYDGYKAGRQKTDDSLSIQIERAHSLVESWGIPVVEVSGFEADDCLGTLARQYQELGYRVVIASGDRDTLQLVSGDDVVVWTLKKNIKESVVFNEPAVYEYYGFGPKLIPDYKALAGDSSDNIPGIRGIGDKTARALVASLGSIEDIYHAIETRPDDVRAVVSNRMFELLIHGREDADFSRILGEIRCDAPVSPIIHATDWVTRASLDSILSVCRAYAFTSLMGRVTDLFPEGGENQLSLFQGEALDSIDDDELRSLQIARWVIDSTKTGETWESLCRWAQVRTIPEVWSVISRELELAQSTFVWESIERPLMPIVARMRERGMLLDVPMLEHIGSNIAVTLTGLSAEIYDMAGGEFNINSPKQMTEVLFERMNISTKGLRKNKSGGYSTQESELEKLREHNPIIDKILEYRGLTKLQSTYIESLPKYCDEQSRIHPWLRQDGAATGRFSCTDPNIQKHSYSHRTGQVIAQCIPSTSRISDSEVRLFSDRAAIGSTVVR